VVFKSLTGPQLRGIVDLMVVDLRNRLIGQGMSIELTDAARDLVAKEGTDPIYGARPLRRAIQTLIEDPLAEALLPGTWKSGDLILEDAVDGQLTFTKGEGEPPALEERIHLEEPRARERWNATPSIPSGGLASDAE
jgi:ATP-dependent Clp protease ATP-binding subunit ClpC